MEEFQVFDWAAIGARIKSKRVLLYCLIPLVFLGVWGLTFSVPTYYKCSTALSTEEVRSVESNRTFMLNRPENFDLGLNTMAYSIVPEDYDEVVASTDFICRLLSTSVTTADSSFTGTYYSYLILKHRYSWLGACKRLIRGKHRPASAEELPALDPFFPRGVAADAIDLVRKSVDCTIDRHTMLTTITVKAQDKLVAALVTQAAADNLKLFCSEYFLGKTEEVYQHLLEHTALVYADYEAAKSQGDNEHAAMLYEAYRSFERQAIVLNAQIRYYTTFTTLNNVTVPSEKAGPHHMLTALLTTAFVVLLALCIICRKELFGTNKTSR